MKVTQLNLTNVRAILHAELKFDTGFNLIVGVNGVGKTTVLDALSISLSAYLKAIHRLQVTLKPFNREDIRNDAKGLSVQCDTRINNRSYRYLIHQPREDFVEQLVQDEKTGQQSHKVVAFPKKTHFVVDAPPIWTERSEYSPALAVLYSTYRSVPSERLPSKAAAAGGIKAACAQSLNRRELRLGEFAQWMHVQNTLSKERATSILQLEALESTVRRFLPNYKWLRVIPDDQNGKLNMVVDREGITIPVRQLSDGERSVLAMVLDLTRRLAQANPHSPDPAATASAVVLIDEIDLHLHPKWQRQVVRNLTEAFPKCQFIATTHSPQIIGEVSHDRIQIIVADGKTLPTGVYSPTHAYGVDSSRVLEEIMDVEPRTHKVQELLKNISDVTAKEDYEKAHVLLEKLIAQIGENDPEVIRIRTFLDFMEDDLSGDEA